MEKHQCSLTKSLSNLPSVLGSDDEGEMKGLLQVNNIWDRNKNNLNEIREEFDVWCEMFVDMEIELK